MAGHRKARPCHPKRDHRDKPGDDRGERPAFHTLSWPGIAVRRTACFRTPMSPAISLRKARPCHPKRDHRDEPGDDSVGRPRTLANVMAGHSRPKDGVLPHAYVPAISLRKARRATPSGITGTRPVMTAWQSEAGELRSPFVHSGDGLAAQM